MTERLTLPLLMAGVRGADHVRPAFAADDLATFANPFDAGPDFHETTWISANTGALETRGRTANCNNLGETEQVTLQSAAKRFSIARGHRPGQSTLSGLR